MVTPRRQLVTRATGAFDAWRSPRSAARTSAGLGLVPAAFFYVTLAFTTAQAADITIGMSAAFTGPSAALGLTLYRGSMAYIHYVNETGGVHGRRIKITAYDDGYDPDAAVENTLRLVEDDKVLLLFDYVGTPTVTRVLPLLKGQREQHIYLFFPYTGAQPQREPPYEHFVFNLRASYRQETAGLVEKFVGIGRTRIGVFYQADAYGRSGWDGIRRALATHGLTIVGEATYRRGGEFAEDYGVHVRTLREATPNAIISIGSYAACAGFIRDARNAGWDVPIANISFVGSVPMLDLLQQASARSTKDYTVNLINSEVLPSYDDSSLNAVRQYRLLTERYDPMPPREFLSDTKDLPLYSNIGLEGFLNAKLLVEVLRRLGSSLERARIPAAAESIRDYDLGIDRPVSFGPGKHQGLDAVYYVTVEDGRFVPITDWSRWRP